MGSGEVQRLHEGIHEGAEGEEVNIVIVLILAYSVLVPHEVAGTFQVVVESGSIFRVDTRSGAVEKCNLGDNGLECPGAKK